MAESDSGSFQFLFDDHQPGNPNPHLGAGVHFVQITRMGIQNTGVVPLEKMLRIDVKSRSGGGGGGRGGNPTASTNFTVMNTFNTHTDINTNSFNAASIKFNTAFQNQQPQTQMRLGYLGGSLTSRRAGQLMIVGSGIRAISDMTLDAEAQIRAAERVLYCVADPVTERRPHALNSSSESLYGLYADDKPRSQTYSEMTAAILKPVRAGLRVCVYSGHPGGVCLVYP